MNEGTKRKSKQEIQDLDQPIGQGGALPPILARDWIKGFKCNLNFLFIGRKLSYLNVKEPRKGLGNICTILYIT